MTCKGGQILLEEQVEKIYWVSSNISEQVEHPLAGIEMLQLREKGKLTTTCRGEENYPVVIHYPGNSQLLTRGRAPKSLQHRTNCSEEEEWTVRGRR